MRILRVIVGLSVLVPRYFVRYILSYEWNKYNQTHFDTLRVPPKSLSGYKFSLFYPLNEFGIHYFLEGTLESLDKGVIIRFSGGFPYLDIAFRMLDSIWEPDIKRGFKSEFELGRFDLFFNFAKLRYRR